MYTLSMILDQLDPGAYKAETIIPKDSVSSVRIFSGRELQPHILYLSETAGSGRTHCRTAAGSAFLMHSDLQQTLNILLDILERFGSWEVKLNRISRRGCTLTELLAAACPLMEIPIFILDNDQWMVAYYLGAENKEAYENKDMFDMIHFQTSSPEKILAFNKLFYDCYQRKDVYAIPGNIFTTTGYAKNLFYKDQFCGLMLTDSFDTPFSAGKLDFFELLGKHIQDMINDSASSLSIGDKDSALLRYLKETTAENEEQLRHRLNVLNWGKKDEKQIIYMKPVPERSLSPNLHHALLIFNRMAGVEAFVFEEGIVLLVNLHFYKDPADRDAVIQRIRQLSYCAGCSNVFTDLTRSPFMFKQATVSLQYGDHTAGAINDFKDYALPCFFFSVQEEDREVLQHPLPETLKLYDKRYGSKLYETCFVYLKNERSLTRTAKEMQLSRGTLAHRIERIEDLSGNCLEEAETRMLILLSYYLEKIRTEKNGRPFTQDHP